MSGKQRMSHNFFICSGPSFIVKYTTGEKKILDRV